MSWIKRNLYFLIGSVVALALLGLAGFYLYSKWSLNSKVLEDLTQKHEDLKKLNGANPHPGSGNINNIEMAKEQIKEAKAAVDKTRPYFQPIPRIPDLPKISDFEFSTALAQTIAQLTREAGNNSVIVPTNASGGGYSFSFQAERLRMGFAPGSLPALSVQLGEVKALCDVLFAAKVNSLDYIRRERVSPDDATGSQSDYLPEKSSTNALAVISPYEIGFHCFSPELAGLLSGLASSSHNFIVQYVNVEIAPAVIAEPTTATPVFAPVYVQPAPTAPAMSTEDLMRSRYGGIRRGDGESAAAFQNRYGISPGKFPTPYATPPPVVQPQPAQPAAAAKNPIVIDEKQLKVTLLVDVVKLLPSARAR